MYKSLFITLIISSALVSTAVAQSAMDLLKKGRHAQDLEQYDEAIEFFTQSIAADKNFHDAYLARAFVYGLQGKHEEAIQDYNEVIGLKPNDSYLYVTRGSEYNKLKQYDLALADFNKAIEIDGENSEAYNNRGWTKKAMGDKDGACKDWKKSKKLGNGEAKIILRNNQC